MAFFLGISGLWWGAKVNQDGAAHSAALPEAKLLSSPTVPGDCSTLLGLRNWHEARRIWEGEVASTRPHENP
jgi:hypothetical protein